MTDCNKKFGNIFCLYSGSWKFKLANIRELRIKIIQVMSVLVEVNPYIIVQRKNDDFLDKISFHFGIEKYILNGFWNLLIVFAFHKRILSELVFFIGIIAINNVPIFFVFLYFSFGI